MSDELMNFHRVARVVCVLSSTIIVLIILVLLASGLFRNESSATKYQFLGIGAIIVFVTVLLDYQSYQAYTVNGDISITWVSLLLRFTVFLPFILLSRRDHSGRFSAFSVLFDIIRKLLQLIIKLDKTDTVYYWHFGPAHPKVGEAIYARTVRRH
ncbi:MAG: hypothetical protein L0154_14355 [Chloroflexi bacterium]|nr:hypothetical protein [Chloroflexota bacterium]